MIFKTIEFIPTDIDSSVDSLQDDVDNGKYDDILNNYCFLTWTNKGLTLVKQDKTIITNAIVDLSEYAKSTNIPDVSNFITKNDLIDYAKTTDLPMFSFDEDGTLLVTINGVTNRYTPEATN